MNVFVIIGVIVILSSLGGLYLIAHKRKVALIFALAVLAGVSGVIWGLCGIMAEINADAVWYQVQSGEQTLVVRTNDVIGLHNPIVTKTATYYWTSAKRDLDDGPGKITVDLTR